MVKSRFVSSSAVVIGSADLLQALVSRAGLDDTALTFSDAEPLQALQAILDNQPRVVVLERLFAATSRGAALINRIKNDPELVELEIRVLSPMGDYSRVVSRPAPAPVTPPPAPAPEAETPAVPASSSQGDAPVAQVPVAEAPETEAPAPGTDVEIVEEPRPLDWHGTRRAPRVRARPGVEIQLDGNPVAVVDMSTLGAQVLSQSMLRPDQRVRVTIPRDTGLLRFRGAIAWARFELPRRKGDPGPHYRVGIEFLDAEAGALGEFCDSNKA
jgi:hypothetical protein